MSSVSIILTVYNIDHQHLMDCLKSIYNQTHTDYEIIIIDDCSSEDYTYLTQRRNVRYFRNEHNLGLCKSVNKAFSLCKGDYILRLGSDDIFSKNLLMKEVNFLDRNLDYGAVCCELQRFGDSVQIIRRPEEWDIETIKSGKIHGYGYAGGMMFRRELLNYCKINEDYKVCEDFDFHLQLLEHSKVKSLNEILYYYRSHGTNIMKKFNADKRKRILRQILNNHGIILYEK
jgi:glycosyltransferase involved in cell wall biosynthesis